jgi:hypothetical protein
VVLLFVPSASWKQQIFNPFPMNELNSWLRFVLASLATWRITHLLAREDGPDDLLARLRARLGEGFFGRLMDCFYCLSIWVAIPMALLTFRRPRDLLLAWLALSGAACLLERIVREPVLIQPIAQSTEGNENNEMLRASASEVEPLSETGENTRSGS